MNISYIRSGDYFIPDLKLPEETRPIGKWGRMHRDHIKEHHPILFNLYNLEATNNVYIGSGKRVRGFCGIELLQRPI